MSILTRICRIFVVSYQHKGRWCLIALCLTTVYYALLLLALMVKFQNFPNYLNVYPWFDNLIRIIESTPSLRDTVLIIKDEWILEVGFMNYDYGIGISEWSLFLAPTKVIAMFFFSGCLASYWILLRTSKQSCATINVSSKTPSKVGMSIGTSLVALTSVTLYWVVCCSTPTWVVGLAMLGLGASLSLWLEPIGFWIQMSGIILMLGAMLALAGQTQINPEKQT